VAAVEAFMLSELSLRREKARLAKVQSRLAPVAKMMKQRRNAIPSIALKSNLCPKSAHPWFPLCLIPLLGHHLATL
jgi:hypothetical protein